MSDFSYPTGDQLPDVPVATWIKGRGFKTHKTISTAKAAFTASTDHTGKFSGGALYRIVGSRWVPCLVIRPGSTQQDYTLWTAPKKWAQAPGITTLLVENPYT